MTLFKQLWSLLLVRVGRQSLSHQDRNQKQSFKPADESFTDLWDKKKKRKKEESIKLLKLSRSFDMNCELQRFLCSVMMVNPMALWAG